MFLTPQQAALIFSREQSEESNSPLSSLPLDVFRYICHLGKNSVSAVEEALERVAFGELDQAKALLDVKPNLVLERGNVVTPGGMNVINTSLLECALGAGDPEMAKPIRVKPA